MNRSALGGVALLLLIATATSCSDDPESASNPDPSPSSTTTSGPAHSTPEPPTPEEKALAQLEAYLDVRDDALRAMKVNRKRLDKVAGGQEYLTVQQRVLEYASNDFSFKGEYSHTFGEPRNRGALTLITDCEDESNVEFLTQEGDPVTRSLNGEAIPVTRLIEYTLKPIKGHWLVTSSAYDLGGDNRVQSC